MSVTEKWEWLKARLRHMGHNGSPRPRSCKALQQPKGVRRISEATCNSIHVCGHWRKGSKQARFSKATYGLKRKAKRAGRFINYWRKLPPLPSQSCLLSQWPAKLQHRSQNSRGETGRLATCSLPPTCPPLYQATSCGVGSCRCLSSAMHG